MGRSNFVFVLRPSSESLKFTMDSPNAEGLKQFKGFLVVKGRPETKESGFPTGIENEVIFMELTRPVLNNLYDTCSEVFIPILNNPLNQASLSDLVSNDLMEKFHSFLAYTYVTMGQVTGKTLLPLPPADVTSNDSRTSNKEKAHILESKSLPKLNLTFVQPPSSTGKSRSRTS